MISLSSSSASALFLAFHGLHVKEESRDQIRLGEEGDGDPRQEFARHPRAKLWPVHAHQLEAQLPQEEEDDCENEADHERVAGEDGSIDAAKAWLVPFKLGVGPKVRDGDVARGENGDCPADEARAVSQSVVISSFAYRFFRGEYLKRRRVLGQLVHRRCSDDHCIQEYDYDTLLLLCD